MLDRLKTLVSTYIDSTRPTIQKTNIAGHVAYPDGGANRPLAPITDHSTILKAGEVEVWAYVCMNAIGKSLSAAPLVAEGQETVDGDLEWVRQDSGDLVDLIAMPNPREPMDILMWRLVVSLLSGDAYLAYDKVDKELFHIHSAYIRPIPNVDGEIDGYMLTRGTVQQRFEPDEIIHIPMPNASDEFQGLSPVQSVKSQILLNKYYLNHLVNYFGNGAVPSGLLSSEQPITQEVAAELASRWREAHGGPGNGNKTAVLGKGLTYQTVSPPLKELMVESLYKMPREAIMAAFGVPPAVGGIYEYANYANSTQQIKLFWQNAILPIMRIVAGTLTIQLARQFGDNLRLRFDISKIEALQEDENEKATRLVTYKRGGILTVNEVRRQIGYDEVEGGDELTPDGGFMAVPEAGGEDGKALESPSPARPSIVLRKADGPQLEAWQLHYKTVTRAERKFSAIMRKFFDGQLDRLLTRLEELKIGNVFMLSRLYPAIRKDASDDDFDEIFDMAFENVTLHQSTDGFVRETIRTSGQGGIDELRLGMTFDLKNPYVQGAIDALGNRLKKVNATTWNKIKDVLSTAYSEGWTLQDIKKELRSSYKQFSKARADTIARTETNSMVNGGHFAGYRQGGATHKKWLCSFLDTSRDSHKDADADGWIPLDQAFIVGGSALMYPGDPAGPPEETINCYCRTIAKIEDEL